MVNGGLFAWLIPSWNFFAPVPGTHTYCLLYRDEGAVMLAAALAAPLTVVERRLLVIVTLLLLAGMLLGSLRSLYGLDGSDQMNLVVLTAAAVAATVPNGSLAWHAAVWFVAVQLALAYLIAGVAKLASPQSRRGEALVGVMSTSSYGNEFLERILRRYTRVGRMLGWSVMALEVAFVLVFVLPPAPRLVVFTAMFSFHLACAVFMGLNNFCFAFVAACPMLWWCTEMSHRFVTGLALP